MPSLAKKQMYCRWGYVLLLVPLVFQACHEDLRPFSDVEVRPTEEKQRYNIVSALSPEREVQWVYLGKFGAPEAFDSEENSPEENSSEENSEEWLRGARVQIKAGDGDLHTLTKQIDEYGNFAFSIENEMLKVLSGARYTLRVTVPGAVFTSSCRVPEVYVKEVKIEAVEYAHSAPPRLQFGDEDEHRINLSIRISWQDLGKRDSFYAVEAYTVVDRFEGEPRREPLSRGKNTFDYESSSTHNYATEDGKIFVSFVKNFGIPEHYDIETALSLEGILGFEIYVLTTNKAMHDYKKATENYEGSGFFGEPTIIPSNIEKQRGSKKTGVQGVLGCYRATRLFVSKEKLIRLAVRSE